MEEVIIFWILFCLIVPWVLVHFYFREGDAQTRRLRYGMHATNAVIFALFAFPWLPGGFATSSGLALIAQGNGDLVLTFILLIFSFVAFLKNSHKSIEFGLICHILATVIFIGTLIRIFPGNFAVGPFLYPVLGAVFAFLVGDVIALLLFHRTQPPGDRFKNMWGSPKTAILLLLFLVLVIGYWYVSKQWAATAHETVPEAFTASSEDKNVTLHIPLGALPEGMTEKDISIQRLEGEQIPESLRRFKAAAVYSLSPNGAAFSKPISFSLTYDNPGIILPYLFHIDGDKGSIPEGLEVDIDYTNKKAVYTGAINSFSFLMLESDIGWPVPLGIEFPSNLGSHRVGDSFPVTAHIEKYSAFLHVDTGSAPYFDIGPYRVSIGEDSEAYYRYVEDPKVEGRFEVIGPVSPKQYLDVPPLSVISGLIDTYERPFTCTEVGTARIIYSIRGAVHLRQDLYTNFSRISDAVDTVLNWLSAEERDFVVRGKLSGVATCLPPRPKLVSFPPQTSCGGSVKFVGNVENLASVQSVQITLLGTGGTVASGGGPLNPQGSYEKVFPVSPGIYNYEIHVRTTSSTDDLKETGKVTVDSCPKEKEKEKDSFGEVPENPPPLVDPGYETPPKDNLPKDTPPKDAPPATEPPDDVNNQPTDSGDSTDGDESSLNTSDDTTDYGTPQMAIIHFSCIIKKEKEADGATRINLIGGTEPLDSSGNYAWGKYLFGGGQANIGRTCFDPGDKAPICIDPRNGAAVDSLDFTTEFPNTPSGQQTFYSWFSQMSGGMRPCSAEEMPVKSETPSEQPPSETF